MATKEELEQAQAATRLWAGAASKLRWLTKTPAERSKWAASIAAQRTPEQMGAAKRSDKPRCPCGLMTAHRAEKRRHICEAPKPAKKPKGKPGAR